MTSAPDGHDVTDLDALLRLYGEPGAASLRKEVDHVHPHYRALIEASPFFVLATSGPAGLDASPRGDQAGAVVVDDARTLLIPDRRGNNRLDSLRNILADPRVALLFLIPGVGETLRVNGRARVTTDPELLARFAVDGKAPRTVIRVSVETVYFQCSRAVVRAGLWDPARQVRRDSLPSTGTILSDLSRAEIDGGAYDRDLPTRLATTLY
ncbi:MAG: pyridoxamine 5'-phosphate oxidase family protein [Alphaproteobacteria bacterium]|nr:pyridoxamine 5'-phosphate oxidase family protein [Alphaproteobacteria bacterium]